MFLLLFFPIALWASIGPVRIQDPSLPNFCENRSPKECHEHANALAKQGKLETAKHLWANNCDKNNYGISCNELGVALARQGNFREAAKVYERACDLNVGIGCSNRACLDNPFAACHGNWKAETAKAQEFYTRGCELEEGVSCYNYGIMMQKMRHPDDALMAFGVGCSYGDKDSCKESGGRTAKDLMEVTSRVKKESKRRAEAKKLGYPVTE